MTHCQTYYYKPQFSAALDTANGRKLLKQCSRSAPKDVSEVFVVTSAQRRVLERNFKKILSLTDTSFALGANKLGKGPKIKRLDSVLYQYAGVIINRKKYIYINAITFSHEEPEVEDSYKKWEKEAIVICDGGYFFWGALFDLRGQAFTQLRLNGD